MQRRERLRDRIGKNGPGLTVAIVAMVLALGGGAFAASGGLTGKQKKEVKKIAKSFQGTGPAGAQGPKGDTGAKGADGSNGTPGTNGTSVTASTEPTGTANCAGLGGSKFVTGATTTFACTGKEGKKGDEGSPWTAGGVLPPEKTETGTWAATGTEDDKAGIYASISFPIPLEEELDATHVVWAVGFPRPEGCDIPGANPSRPAAKPGYLCVYPTSPVAPNLFDHIGPPVNPELGGESGAGSPGAFVAFKAPAEGSEETAVVTGTFAVTAPPAAP